MSENNEKGIFLRKKNTKPASGSAPTGPKKDVKKRWMLITGGFIALVVIASNIFKSPEQMITSKKEQPKVSVNPEDSGDRRLSAELGGRVNDVEVKSRDMAASLANKDKEIAELRDSISKMAAAQKPAAASEASGQALGSGSVPPPPIYKGPGAGATSGVLNPPSMPNTAGSSSAGTESLPNPGSAQAPISNVPSLTPPNISGESGQKGTLTYEPDKDGPQSKTETGGSSESKGVLATALSATTGGVTAKSSFVKNPLAGTLPVGSFAEISFLNGIDAATSTTAASDPMPVLLNITDNAILPGSARYKVKNCFLLGTGYGNMSSERVYVRTSRISCVDKKNKLLLTQEVQGYVVDSDNKLGMRGVVTDKQGAKLGKALLAGFANGLAGALGSAQNTVTTSSLTGGSTSSITGSAALKASGLAGAQAATAQLAEFYLKEAQNMFPVITIDAGRTATVVFTSSTPLIWTDGTSQYVQEIKPETK